MGKQMPPVCGSPDPATSPLALQSVITSGSPHIMASINTRPKDSKGATVLEMKRSAVR